MTAYAVRLHVPSTTERKCGRILESRTLITPNLRDALHRVMRDAMETGQDRDLPVEVRRAYFGAEYVAACHLRNLRDDDTLTDGATTIHADGHGAYSILAVDTGDPSPCDLCDATRGSVRIIRHCDPHADTLRDIYRFAGDIQATCDACEALLVMMTAEPEPCPACGHDAWTCAAHHGDAHSPNAHH